MSLSIKLQPVSWRHLTLSGREISKKIFKNFKRAILENPCKKICVVESAFNRITGIDSRYVTLLKKASSKE